MLLESHFRAGAPSGVSIGLFVTNALILAVGEATEDTDFANSIAELGMDMMTSSSGNAVLAFNLGYRCGRRPWTKDH